MKIQGFGWRPSLPDARDRRYDAGPPVALPSNVDLRRFCPPVYDQGNLGSCVSNASEAAYRMALKRQNLPDFEGSRLALYYMTRALEGLPEEDAGSEIRDAVKIMLADGLVAENEWPYDIVKFAERPPQTSYHNALSHQAVGYYALAQDGASYHLRHALAQGYPVIFGSSIYESFESSQVTATGKVPMPDLRRERIVGGHAMLAVGYDAGSRVVIVRNSWNSDWGANGYCYMPMDFVCSPRYSDDLWIIKTVEG